MSRYACQRQHDQRDCGAAALATVAQQHRLQVGIGRIRELVGTDRAGTTLLGLLRGAERIGFAATGAKGDWDGLRQAPLPAICHVRDDGGRGHFVVVHRLRRDRVLVADPGEGLRERSRADFVAAWTGYALLLAPNAVRAIGPAASKAAFVRALVSPQRGVLIGAMACALALTVLSLGNAFFLQHLVDDILVHDQRRALDFGLAGLAGIALFRAAFEVIRSWFVIDASRKIDLVLISCYMRQVVRQPLRFFETRRVGEILSRVGDAIKIRQLIGSTAPTILVDALTLAVAAAVMLATDWPLALTCLAFVPAIVAVVALLRRPLARRQRALMAGTADLEGQFVEDVGGVETLKAFDAERLRLDRVDAKLVRIASTLMGAGSLTIALQAATGLLIALGTLAVQGYGAHRVLDGHLTIGTLVFFSSLAGYLYGPVERLASVSVAIQDAAIALDRLWEVISLALEDHGAGRAAPKPAGVASEVRFAEVGFAYGHRPPILSGLDLVIPAGRTVAVVGESGCGKSTLCKLLAKLHEPTAGRILVDGTDLRELGHGPWRRKIGYVTQDAHVFNGTIAENIALGRPRAGAARIARAARIAGLHRLIESLPERYATVVGERGINLSGGQRQRLSIARAVLANPRIVILDEATSHLDTLTERAIQRTLSRALRGRTVLVVAHRLSTVRRADLIYVLAEGRLAQRGTHEELIRRDGLYRRLWLAQAGEEAPASRPEPDDDDDDSPLYILDADDADADDADASLAPARAVVGGASSQPIRTGSIACT